MNRKQRRAAKAKARNEKENIIITIGRGRRKKRNENLRCYACGNRATEWPWPECPDPKWRDYAHGFCQG
jgi:hypothetical protein